MAAMSVMSASAPLQRASRLLFRIWMVLSLVWVGIVSVAAIGIHTLVPSFWAEFAALVLVPPLFTFAVGWAVLEAARHWHQRTFRLLVAAAVSIFLAAQILIRLCDVLAPREPWQSIYALLTGWPLAFVVYV